MKLTARRVDFDSPPELRPRRASPGQLPTGCECNRDLSLVEERRTRREQRFACVSTGFGGN